MEEYIWRLSHLVKNASLDPATVLYRHLVNQIEQLAG